MFRRFYCLMPLILISKIVCQDNMVRYPSGGTMSAYRLPNTTIPRMYNIIITADPNFDKYFSGIVKIKILALSPTNSIILHANGLKIQNITVKSFNKKQNLCKGWKLSENDTYFLELYLKDNLKINFNYDIIIKYVGYYAEDMRGLYIGSYIDDDYNKRFYVTSDFSLIGARRMFPCYDEPALKAIFQMHIYSPIGFKAHSNMDRIPTQLPDKQGFIPTTFKPSPYMSTYLVFILISDFKSMSNILNGPMIYPKKYIIHVRPNAYESAKYALETGQKALLVMESYINDTFLPSKMGIAVMPNFPVIAMENLGLMAFREANILINPSTSTTSDIQFTTMLIFHETSHSWFGNKNTPTWWDYYWLSEGFARYLQFYLCNSLTNGEWRLMDQFVVIILQMIMVRDSSENTQALSVNIRTPSDIVKNMNEVIYDKGASVLRMMSHVLGEDVFRQGLIRYANTLSNSATEPKKLYSALQIHDHCLGFLPCETSVEEVFDSWTTQVGYPLVNAERSEDGRIITITQSRYHSNNYDSSDEKWWIPLTWATDSEPSFENTDIQAWIEPNMESKDIEINPDDRWFILNKQQIGYFRVMYTENNWNNLIEALNSPNFGGIHYLNRAQLIDDSLEFSKTCRMSYKTSLDLISYLRNEYDLIPWISAYRGFFHLNSIMVSTKHYPLYKKFIRSLVQRCYDHIGYVSRDDDDHLTKVYRSTIVSIACNSGHSDCLSKSIKRSKCLMKNDDCNDNPDLNSIAYCIGLKHGNEEQWDDMFNKYVAEKNSAVRQKIISVLACTESSEITQKYLNMMVMNNSKLSRDDHKMVISSVIMAGPNGISEFLEFLSKNFKSLQLDSLDYTLKLIHDLSKYIVKVVDYKKFHKIFQENKSMFAHAIYEAAMNAMPQMKNRCKSIKNARKQIESWLLNNVD